MNYAQWISRAVRFVELLRKNVGRTEITAEIEPPLSVASLSSSERAIYDRLPCEYQEFLVQGSGRCKCKYFWKWPSDWPNSESLDKHKLFPTSSAATGGPDFLGVHDIAREMLAAEEVAGYLKETTPYDAEFWATSIPFMEIGNCDCLGLKTSDGRTSVVYLSQGTDNASKTMYATFDEFLSKWEEMCYVGPAEWIVEPFLNQGDSTDDTSRNILSELREFFELGRGG